MFHLHLKFQGICADPHIYLDFTSYHLEPISRHIKYIIRNNIIYTKYEYLQLEPSNSPWPSGSPAVHRILCRESQTSNFHRGCIRSCHRLDVFISRKAGSICWHDLRKKKYSVFLETILELHGNQVINLKDSKGVILVLSGTEIVSWEWNLLYTWHVCNSYIILGEDGQKYDLTHLWGSFREVVVVVRVLGVEQVAPSGSHKVSRPRGPVKVS